MRGVSTEEKHARDSTFDKLDNPNFPSNLTGFVFCFVREIMDYHIEVDKLLVS